MVYVGMPPAVAVNLLKSCPKNMSVDDKAAIVGKEESIDRSLSSHAGHDEHKGLDDSELPDYQDPEVKKIMRKVDLRLPPVLAVLYLFSFLDRSNIGNAKIAGMTKTLKMTGHDYNIALTVFFFPYACFMIPSNMVLKKVRPATWMAFLMTGWGIAMMCHGWVQTKGQLIACRCIMGLFESGFFPAAAYLCTLWYCRFEYQQRVAYFYSSATLAGAFSGILAYGLEKLEGKAGYEGWRWIFIVEGIVTIVVGMSTYWILPNSPQTCTFLNEREKSIIARRLAQDSGTKDGKVINNGDGFRWPVLRDVLLDKKLWLGGVMVCAQSIPFYAFTFFAPTIIKELGFKTWKAQLMTVPVYMVACIGTLVIAYYADKQHRRWPFVAFPYTLSACAFIAMLAIPHPRYPGLTYGFLFCIPLGLSSGVNALIAWVGNNLAPSWRRAIGMAFITTLANFGGAIGANIYLAEQAPKYPLGFGFSLGVLVAGITSAFVMRFLLRKANRERDNMDPAVVKSEYTEQQLLDLGDKSPLYRYVI
ncbi:hypothetical protein AC579_5227 [Pseudocercospora musae]|uniref:Major facilitator superfamily (MFS) profile domain-containing protein n=1 Tax=Pseudocercospora musae TaxID=113226 RepID=A0A139IQ21_9PEZI|nr:hypothetical protein AC579_5227 [Pseudocercospora musae]